MRARLFALDSSRMPASVTYQYDEEALSALLETVETRGFKIENAPHAHFRASASGCSVTFYKSGKLLIQGKEVETWAEVLAPRNILAGQSRFARALDLLPSADTDVGVGSDESGKGDFFGPLVVCAVRVERSQIVLLEELGAADCKSLTDQQVFERAKDLKLVVEFSRVVLMPTKYNPLYRKMGKNLNRTLAWAHARAIENLLEKDPAIQAAVVDKFGPVPRLERAMLERGRAIPLIQRHRAEDDPAVAVASILARSEFLWRLRSLGKQFSLKLPKGAGGPVIAAGKAFVAKHGPKALGEVGKLHFKTTERIIDLGL